MVLSLFVLQVLAGLALFLFAMSLLTRSLKEVGGRHFHRAVARATSRRLNGFLFGALAGAGMQSMAAVSFVLVGMLRSGLMTVERAVAIVAGANIGAAAIVFVAVLETRTAALLAVAIGGLVMLIERWQGLSRAATILFAFGLLLFGLGLMQHGAAPMVDQPWVHTALVASADSYLLGFLAGIVLTMVIQSSIAVAVLAVVMIGSGGFGLEQVVMVIYGSNLGSSVLSAALSMKLRGRSLQIAMAQILFNVLGCVVLVPLFYLELRTGVPGVVALLGQVPGGEEWAVPVVFLLFNVVAALIVFAFPNAIVRACARLSPPRQVEDIAQPEYISEHALVDADLALSLVRLEMLRLIEFLPRGLEAAREGRAASAFAALLEGATVLSLQIGRFLEELAVCPLQPDQAEALSSAMKSHRLIDSLGATVDEFARDVVAPGGVEDEASVVEAMNEAADVALITLAVYAREGEVSEAEFLAAMTSATGETMTRIRRAVIGDDVAPENRVRLLRLTNLFERLFWLIGQTAESLKSEGANADDYAPAPARAG